MLNPLEKKRKKKLLCSQIQTRNSQRIATIYDPQQSSLPINCANHFGAIPSFKLIACRMKHAFGSHACICCTFLALILYDSCIFWTFKCWLFFHVDNFVSCFFVKLFDRLIDFIASICYLFAFHHVSKLFVIKCIILLSVFNILNVLWMCWSILCDKKLLFKMRPKWHEKA